MSNSSAEQNKSLPKGGGEMGELIRKKNWSETPLGVPDRWPQSLLTALSIVINSKFPMFIFWGEHNICFYNDAYRPSLGNNGKHPSMLGKRGAEAWPEIWDTIIKPLIDRVSTGESIWGDDELVPIYRNGAIEDVYWTYSYSPINDESGKPGGTLVTCNETTEKVLLLKTLKEREDQLNFTLDAAGLATWDFDPITGKFTGNARIKEWFGLSSETITELRQALNTIVEKDRARVIEAIDAALQPGSSGHYEIMYNMMNSKTGQERKVLAKGKALFENNKAYRFSGILEDITQQASSIEKLEASEKRFRNIVKQAPLGITIFRGEDFMVEMANDTYLQVVDRSSSEFVGKPLLETLPEVREAVKPLLKNVLETGVPYYGFEFPVTLNRYGKSELTYFNFVYYPLKEDDGTISGIMVVAIEVTESVKAKQLLAESEKQFRNLVMQSPIPMAIFRGPDYVIEIANQVLIEKIWRKKPEEVIGKKVLEIFPELIEQKYPELLNRVFTSSKTYREAESPAYVKGNDGLKKFYLDFEYAPLFETNGSISGIIVTVNDVTEKVEARQKIEENEERLNIVISASELATWELNVQTGSVNYSDRYLEIFGYSKDTKLTHPQIIKHIHPDDLAMRNKSMAEAYQTGVLYYIVRLIWNDSSIHWVEGRGKVFYDADHKPTHLIGTLRDVTEEKKYQQQLEEREQKFRLLADSMPQHVWTSDTEGNLNYFNHSVYLYTGLSPVQIINDGWLRIIHPDDRERNIKAWMQAVKTGNDFLIEHRFRRHDGIYRWQLSRAVAQRDQEGNIQMWVGTSTDIQDQKNFSDELEKQIQERTAELKQKNNDLEKMNAELQSFAYVSSHDLQEPLRKIQTFASRILEKEYGHLSEHGKDYFIRMQDAAKRMQTLIEDLLAYSRTNTTERIFKTVKLDELVEEVKQELRELISENKVTVENSATTTVHVIPFQFRQLMHNLIGNSIKFARQGIPSHIKIESKVIKGKELKLHGLSETINYCRFSITDNGIGFDPQYKERIFEVFQRLHAKSEYKGTGIGLAIVKKIVENHNGTITATGEPNKGSRFDIYIPFN